MEIFVPKYCYVQLRTPLCLSSFVVNNGIFVEVVLEGNMFLKKDCYFRIFVIFPLKRIWSFILTYQNPFLVRMVCTTFGLVVLVKMSQMLKVYRRSNRQEKDGQEVILKAK